MQDGGKVSLASKHKLFNLWNEGSLENDPGSFRTEIRFACYQQAGTEENTIFRMDWPRVNFIGMNHSLIATEV
jgi:hypothetical protein